MRRILINGISIESMKAVHNRIKKSFRFPSYYGRNLDALYDLLSTEDRRAMILFFDSKGFVRRFGSGGEALMETFQDAALENRRIRFIRIERKGGISRGRVV